MKFWSRAVMAAAGIAFAMSAVAGYAASPPSPSRPSGLKAAAADSRVNLTWTAAAPSQQIDQYIITRTPAASYTVDAPFTSPPSYMVTGLTNGTAYTFRVSAHNATGTSTASLPVSATPRAVPPGRPTNLGATQTGPGQVRLDWTPPTTNGSMPDGSAASITRYNITVNPGGTSVQVPATTLTYSKSGLADNITYTFGVSATNTRPTNGAAAVVYAPLPTGANIGLNPTAGRSTTAITVTGQLFLKNESVTLYWDLSTHVAASVVTDDTGGFTKVVKPRAGDLPKVHRLCASVQPKPCANFTLQAAPKPTPASPTPSEAPSPSPSPTDTPQASGARPGGAGINGLDIITRPPFVFLPIIGIVGLVGLLAYWLLSSRRRPMPPPSSATVVHRATRPDYMAPFPTAGGAPPTPQAAPEPSAWDAPVQTPPPVQPPAPPPFQPPAPPPFQPPPTPYAPPPTPYTPPPVPPQATPPAPPPRTVEWPAPPNPPAAPDEPPDLPQPSD